MRAVASAIAIILLVPAALLLVPAAATQLAGPTPLTQAVDSTRTACGPSEKGHIRTTLYFGLTRPTGTVSEKEWQAFLRDQVTPRFPDGLTVWEANGQWRRPDGRIGRERSKVLLLIHDETPAVREALGAVIASYKRAFEQESVLWESARICATF